LFESRYAPNGAGGGCKFYNGKQWCKKTANLATAAVPGTSNHGFGLAIDTAAGVHPQSAASISAHPQWPWFRANAERYGFSWELQSEPWHIRYVTGDTIPQAVLDFENPPLPPLPPDEDDDMKIGYYVLPPTGRENDPQLVVVDASVRYRTNSDVDGLLPSVRFEVATHGNQYDILLKTVRLA
jgi:hypothetical protein